MAGIDYRLEFPLGSVSPKQLWLMLSTAVGLSSWIDAEVSIDEEVATFHWSGGGSDDAKITIDPIEHRVCFEWLDEEQGFELRITCSELTKELCLVIQDTCEQEDYDTNCQIWQQQVQVLYRTLGLQL